MGSHFFKYGLDYEDDDNHVMFHTSVDLSKNVLSNELGCVGNQQKYIDIKKCIH